METLRYMLVASLCLSLFYIAYRLVFKREENFRQMRIFLLASVAMSLALPLYTGRIEIPFGNSNQQVTVQYNISEKGSMDAINENISPALNWNSLILKIYLVVAALLMIRILMQLLILSWHFLKSEKIRREGYILLVNHRIKTTFSFFDWIFIHPSGMNDEELEQIIVHEKVHAHQYHSFDLVIMELTSCLMWFNPFIWMMKNSLQLVHEYLADEGVINTGIDKLKYQALLINQASEDKLISLFSGFNHSLIKKRMKKMLNTRLNRGASFKWVALLPVSLCLLLIMALLNGFFTENTKAADSAPESSFGFSTGSLPLHAKTTGDTIKKKVIKIVNHNGKIDTTVNETYNIAVEKDKEHNGKVYKYKTIIKDGDTSHYEYVFKNGDPDDIDIDMNDREFEISTGDNRDIHKEVKVVIETKGASTGTSSSSSSSASVSTSSQDNIPSNTLVIIDGIKHTEKSALSSLDPDKIESMNVIKDKKMMKQYTDKDYEGVIIIKTKQGNK